MSAWSSFTLNRLLYCTNFIIKNLHLGKLFSIFSLGVGYGMSFNPARSESITCFILTFGVRFSCCSFYICRWKHWAWCLNSYTLRCLQQQATVQSEPCVLLLAWRLELINMRPVWYIPLLLCITQFNGAQVICWSPFTSYTSAALWRNRCIAKLRKTTVYILQDSVPIVGCCLVLVHMCISSVASMLKVVAQNLTNEEKNRMQANWYQEIK